MGALQPLSLFDDLTPHGYCLLWDPVLIWTHLGSDIAIAAAYLSIPAGLVMIARRRPDLNAGGVAYFFAAFIIMCAITHIFGVLTLWYPVYSLEAVAKVMTAIISVATSVVVFHLLDSIVKTPTQDAFNKLAQANAELEARVEARTTELRRANKRLEVVAAEAQEAEQVKAEFLARMSHELRTPLNAVIGFTDLMSMELAGPLNDTQQGYCRSIRGASAQLLDQINDVLDLERLIQHGPNFQPESVAIDGMIDDVCEMLLPAAEEAEVRLKADTRTASTLRTDERAIRTMLTNLLSNAIKYSRKGGLVEVVATTRAGSVEIAIRDQGVGIPEDKIDDVFQPFFRGHERDLPSVGGTGLGLTLVKQLVDAMAGDIEIDSTQGAGTTVRLTLPELEQPAIVEPREARA